MKGVRGFLYNFGSSRRWSVHAETLFGHSYFSTLICEWNRSSKLLSLSMCRVMTIAKLSKRVPNRFPATLRFMRWQSTAIATRVCVRTPSWLPKQSVDVADWNFRRLLAIKRLSSFHRRLPLIHLPQPCPASPVVQRGDSPPRPRPPSLSSSLHSSLSFSYALFL